MDNFSSSDVYLAASLNALGFFIVAIDRENPERCQFVFTNSMELQAAVAAFWQKSLLLEPQILFGSLRSLKWRLHEDVR